MSLLKQARCIMKDGGWWCPRHEGPATSTLDMYPPYCQPCYDQICRAMTPAEKDAHFGPVVAVIPGMGEIRQVRFATTLPPPPPMTRNDILLAITEAEAAGDTDGVAALKDALARLDGKTRSDAQQELHPEDFPPGERRWPIKYLRIVTKSGKKVWASEHLD